MSNQLQITGGAKVRNLEGVLTGTSGVVSSLGINVPSGIPQLDGSGKILVSQLPNSVMEYKGTWSAATNTPTLANGTGNAGDVYLCDAAGTVNFGAGPITFAVGDQVLYSGTIWQKASGATGTVTSVALTESGDALTITGSPITTSGTINIGFAGTGSQYIKGDGTLATFPTTIDQAKRLITEVYNSTGATLTKGTVVYINGGQGNLPTVTKAQANNDANSAQTYGVVQDDITNMNNGFVVVLGSLTDLDTSAYVVGTQLYLSGTTAGAWTSTKPSAPIHLVYVAIVVRSHPTQGVVEVRIQNGYELEELHDVAISAPVNNQGIFYNSSNDLWENKSIATALGYTPADAALVVPYTGATTNVDLGSRDLLTRRLYLNTNNQGIYARDSAGTNLYQIFALNSSDKVSIDQTGLGTVFGGNVDLGTNFLKARTFYSEGSGGGGSYAIKNGTTPSFEDGYTVLSSNDYRLNIVSTVSAATKAVYFGFSGVTATRTYTLPDASGTLALTSNLSSYVPYTGATTDVNLGSYTLSSAGISTNIIYANGSGLTPGTILLKQSTVPFTASGYNGIYANSTTYGFIASSGATYKQAVFSLSGLTDATLRTFTLPDASGTIALTSDLSNYVTLTGASQTISSAKSFTSFPTTFKDVIIDGSGTSASGVNLKIATGGFVSAGGGYITLYSSASKKLFVYDGTSASTAALDFSSLTSAITRTFTFPDANGTIALTSNLSAYLPLTGGTLTGALNGTSATFSGAVQSDYLVVGTTAATSGGLRLGTQVAIRARNVANTANIPLIESTASDGVSVSNGALILASTGAATFSSDIQGGGDLYFNKATRTTIYPTTTNQNLHMKSNGSGVLQFNNDNTGNLTMCVGGGNVGIGTASPLGGATERTLHLSDGGAGFTTLYITNGANTLRGIFAIGNSAGTISIGTQSNTDLRLVTNDTEKVRITSGGDIQFAGGAVRANGGYFRLANLAGTTAYGYFIPKSLWIGSGTDQAPSIAAEGNYGISFFTNGTTDEKMKIFYDGYIAMNSVVFGTTTAGTTRTLYIGNSNYIIGGISSVRKSKTNIENVSNVDWIYDLNPVTFNYRKADENKNYTDEFYEDLNYGLIAEDTAPVADFLINYNDKEDGTKEMIGIEYPRLIVPLLKAIQELNAKVSALENKS
jgi:hypothetical protein